MPTLSQLPSGRRRVHVRRGGTYKAATFDRQREAEDWDRTVERQAKMVAVQGYAPPLTGATPADLVDRYRELHLRHRSLERGRPGGGSRMTHCGRGDRLYPTQRSHMAPEIRREKADITGRVATLR